jgi:putative transposase
VAHTQTDSGSPETTVDTVDEQLAAQLVAQARSQGLNLIGEGGLLHKLTKMVLESAVEGEMSDHLGYPCGDPAGAQRRELS